MNTEYTIDTLPIHRDGDLKQGLLDLIDDLPSGLIMAEVGCFQGESATLFLDSGKIKRLYAIDTWKWGIYILAEQAFDRNMVGRNEVVKLKMDLNQAFASLPVLDFIYIDGNHRYPFVKRDIENAKKLVKKGGIIAGHDYYQHRVCHVKQAVDEIFGKPDKVYKDLSWIIHWK